MSVKEGMSKFGKFLSGMVMPNIGAFIAWGFLTALFTGSGWLPNEAFAQMISPMLSYLIPVLIAAQGGYLVGGDRGRIIGAIAVIGCILGAPDYPMLMGAMAMGPFAGWVIKQLDRYMENRMPSGFEMLIENFSLGILGMLLAMLGYVAVGPIMSTILVALTAGVRVLIDYSLMPLLALFIEPAKVLFLNNAINHGIFTPIGLTQVQETGRSIMYMLEANPGPGLGVLLAYCFFAKDKKTKQSAPGAVIIHFLGGIHEIYFPYVLMNPKVIIAPIVGNACAILWFSITGAGMVAPASPGSIIAFLGMTPPECMLSTIAGVAIATAVSFAIASPIVRTADVRSLDEAAEKVRQQKGTQEAAVISDTENATIIFACDAGMGSSAMGATKFHNRIKAERPDLTVTNTSVDTIPADADVVVCQRVLADRAAKCAPQAQLVTLDNFLADPHLDALYNALTSTTPALDAKAEAAANEEIVSDLRNAAVAPLAAAVTEASKANDSVMKIQAEDIQLGLPSVTKEEAIRAAGALLAKRGYVDDSYADAMVEREKLVSTYMGMGVAIPHGTSQKKGTVKKSGVVLLQYPQGVDFGDEKAYLVFGIAGVGNDHLDLLGNVCEILEDEDALEQLKTTSDMNYVLEHLQ